MVEEENKSVLKQAQELLDKVEQSKKETAELLEKAEKAKINDMLSGRSQAQIQPRQKRKLTEKEYAKAFFKGEVKLNEPEPEIEV